MALESLVAGVQGRLAALCHARIGPHLRRKLDIEDAVQETLTRAFSSIEDFVWQGEDSFFRWLGGITERVILEVQKREEKRKTLQLARDVSAREPSASTVLRREERFARLEKALQGLSPEHREVILLARIDGLPLKEIAKQMDRSLDAVKQLLSRALKKLKASFGETESLALPPRALKRKEPKNGRC